MAQEIQTVSPPPAKVRRRPWPRYVAIGAALLLVAFLVARGGMRGGRSAGVTTSPAAQGAAGGSPIDEAVIPVVTAVVRPASLTEHMEVTGSLKTDENVILSSKLAGKIVSLPVCEGDTVRAGQLVAQIDDTEQRAQRDRSVGAVRSAEAKLAQAKAGRLVKDTGAEEDYARARATTAAARAKLAELGHAAKIQDTTADTRVRSAQAGLESAKEHLQELKEGSRRQELQMARQAVDRAQIDLDNAARSYQRRQALVREGAISQQEADDAQRSYQQAQVLLQDAKEQQSLTQEGPRTQEVRMAEQQVAQAEQALQDALANQGQRQMSQEEVSAAREAVRQAEAAERSSRAGLVQSQLSQEDINSAAATVDQLKGDVSYYDELMRQTRIVSPVSGTVTQKLANLGEFLSLGGKIVNIVSRDSLFLEAVVSERQLTYLLPGQHAQVTVDVRPGRTYAGVIREILPVAEGLSRSSRVRISLRGGQNLPIGAFARATLPVSHRTGVITVPNDAILTEAGVNYVFTVVNGRARRRNIELGIREGDQVEVRSGLRLGDQVITAGSPAVVDGARVKAQS